VTFVMVVLAQLRQAGKVKQSQYKWWGAMKALFGATMAGPGLDPLQLQATKDFIDTQKGETKCCELY
jgi:hypothetical protein